ncbi:MAG: hypothetical protein ABEH81_01845 [Halopenitus sp.]
MKDPARTTETGTRHSDEQAPRPPESRSSTGGERVPALQLAVVNYDGRPDRGTIYPADSNGIERMETWLSVDMSLVVDASAWR